MKARCGITFCLFVFFLSPTGACLIINMVPYETHFCYQHTTTTGQMGCPTRLRQLVCWTRVGCYETGPLGQVRAHDEEEAAQCRRIKFNKQSHRRTKQHAAHPHQQYSQSANKQTNTRPALTCTQRQPCHAPLPPVVVVPKKPPQPPGRLRRPLGALADTR